jgi:hypothetical protein
MDLNKKIKSLKNLPQYKNKTDEELEKIAQEQLEQEGIIGSLTFCIDDEEERFAKNLLQNYLAQSSFESFSERQTLCQLIDQELLAKRIKSNLKKEYDKDTHAVPLEQVEQLDAVVDRIEKLKEKLGLSQKKDEKNDASKIINNLLERFHKHANKPENKSNYEFQCPKCLEIFLIRQRLDKITDEVKEHPWFIKDGVLFNREIFIDLELGKISIDQVARYLNATQDYIIWIKNNYKINEDIEEKEDDDQNL